MDANRIRANVPQELQEKRRWICWRYEQKHDKLTKVPYNAWDQEHASCTDETTWAPFERAVYMVERKRQNGDNRLFRKYEGVSYALAPGVLNLVAVDLDHCLDPKSGLLTEFALDIVTRLQTYTEVSPSGTGLHLICYGTLPGNRCRPPKLPIEIYSQWRFLTMTGDILTPYGIEERTKELAELYSGLFPPAPPMPPSSSLPPVLTDTEILRIIPHTRQGAKFQALMGGYTGLHDDNDSQADQALCCILAGYTRNPAQMARLFGQSVLSQRDKWGREDYRQRTIRRAIETARWSFQPRGMRA